MGAYLKFPDRLAVRFIDSISRVGIPDLPIIVTIFARKKNNYSVARVTGFDGSIVIIRSEMKASILQDKDLFMMDYSSELEECYPEIQIKVCSPEEARNAAMAMEAFKKVVKIDESIINGFKVHQDHLYGPYSKKILLDEAIQDGIFEIEIQRIEPSI